MFAGLLVTAGVAAVVQTNPRLLAFAEDSFFLLFIAQIAIVVGITGAINRISALGRARACSSSTPPRSGSRSG